MDKIYVGTGKEKQLKYGPVIDIVIDVDSIIREFENHGFTTDQGKRKIKLKIAGRKETDQYGNTHYVELDTWHPDNYQTPNPSGETNQSNSFGSTPEPKKPTSGFGGFTPADKKPDPNSFEGSQIPFEDDTIPF